MGHDVLQAAAHARQHIGYCPQQNVLFSSLTVWEHLLLFCAIKGLVGGAFSDTAAAASKHIMQVGMCAVGSAAKTDAWSVHVHLAIQPGWVLSNGSMMCMACRLLVWRTRKTAGRTLCPAA
jgi:hypothetical protein